MRKKTRVIGVGINEKDGKKISGAEGQNRTDNLQFTKLLLYH